MKIKQTSHAVAPMSQKTVAGLDMDKTNNDLVLSPIHWLVNYVFVFYL